MKKLSLSLVALIATSACCFAQLSQTDTGEEKIQSTRRLVPVGQQPAKTGSEESARRRKSAATGVYYNKPTGAFYLHWNEEGYGYGYEAVIVPPMTTFTFVNKCSNPTTCLWHMTDTRDNTWYDYTSYADSDGNISFSVYPGYYMPAPTIVNAAQTDSFTIGNEFNYYYINYGPLYQTLVTPLESVDAVGFASDHGENIYTYGSLSTGYLYGTGNINGSPCTGVEQSYPAPISPLYVEDIFLQYMSDGTTALDADAALTMYIYATGSGELLETLTATADDMDSLTAGNTQYTSTGKYTTGYIHFSKKTTDDNGDTAGEPFTLSSATTFVIEGFDLDGVNIGLCGGDIPDDCLDELPETSFLVYDADSLATIAYSYDTCTVDLTFNGIMDAVFVADELSTTAGAVVEDANYVRVSEDGTECWLANEERLPGAYVMTALDWYDEDGDENYYFDIAEEDEWVEGWLAESGVYSDAYCLSFTTSRLDDSTTGRYAILYLQGKGVQGETPVVVIQGDVDLDEIAAGITSVTTDSRPADNTRIYNLAGQEVTGGARGILIRDGKKYLNK